MNKEREVMSLLRDDERTRCEVWKDVKGYDGKYQVSNLGRFKSNGKILDIKPYNGYCRIVLIKNSVKKSCCIHRLVYDAFKGISDNKNVIHHIDKNKVNNNIDNLKEMTVLLHNRHHFNGVSPYNKGTKYGETEAYKKSNKSRRGNYIKECLSMMKEFYKNKISVTEFSKLKNITTRTFYERKKFLCSLVQY